MNVRFAAIALVAGALLLPGTAPARVDAKPRLKRVAESLVAHGAPGAIVVVRDRAGTRGYAAGYANVRGKQRMTPQARSNRKSDQDLHRDGDPPAGRRGAAGHRRPVELWLPGLHPDGARITLRHLLNHSSGVFNYTDDLGFLRSLRTQPRRVWAPRELVEIATAHPLLFPPGSSWSYSNTNYILLGLVVEAVTGRTVGEELESRIFRPLGLNATSLPSTRAMPAPYAHGYLSRGNGFVPSPGRRVDVTSWFDPSWAWAAGAIVSNGIDLTRFYAALLSGEVLSPVLLAEMSKTFGDSGYRLGIETARSPCGIVWGHAGAVPGYLTVILGREGGGRVGLVMVNWDELGGSGVYLGDAAEASACAA